MSNMKVKRQCSVVIRIFVCSLVLFMLSVADADTVGAVAVTTPFDSGAGSLRQFIADAYAGSTITPYTNVLSNRSAQNYTATAIPFLLVLGTGTSSSMGGVFMPGAAFHETNDSAASELIGSMKVTF